MPEVITNNLDLWSSALLSKSTAGRGSNSKLEAYGIKKLRELILELAVRGKLVPQDANDEPASELLKRIQAEKTKLIAEGKIKKDKPLPPIAEEVKPFDLPNGWAYSNLGDVVEIVRGITFPGNEKSKDPADGRIACLRTTNVQDQIEWDDILYIREEFVSREDQLLKPCDIVMSMANSRELVGKVALVGEEISQKTTFGGFLGVLRPFFIVPRFVMALLRTPHAREMLIDSASQTTNIANVSLAKLRPLFFAIPPLAEQHRIVAKVDELMALCDQLEQQQAHSLEAHQYLVESLLGTLTRVESQNNFSESWARIVSHFDTLFTTEASIDQLKQTILQLAVMGKLVPQDPNDEPARELLKRIQAEKTKLISEGKIKREKLMPPITEDEKPFELPHGWEWQRLANLCDLENGDRGKNYPNKSALVESGIPFVNAGHLQNGQIDRNQMTFITREHFDILGSGKFREDDILFCLRGSLGKSALVKGFKEGAIASSLVIIRLLPNLDATYFVNYFDSPLSIMMVGKYDNGTAQPNLSSADLGKFLIPLPPLSEQHRIVAKFDEFMALCDALKARLADAQTIQVKLADAIVEQAVC